jgi:hypothetical protein
MDDKFAIDLHVIIQHNAVTVQIAPKKCKPQGEKCEFTRVNDHFLTPK